MLLVPFISILVRGNDAYAFHERFFRNKNCSTKNTNTYFGDIKHIVCLKNSQLVKTYLRREVILISIFQHFFDTPSYIQRLKRPGNNNYQSFCVYHHRVCVWHGMRQVNLHEHHYTCEMDRRILGVSLIETNGWVLCSSTPSSL